MKITQEKIVFENQTFELAFIWLKKQVVIVLCDENNLFENFSFVLDHPELKATKNILLGKNEVLINYA